MRDKIVERIKNGWRNYPFTSNFTGANQLGNSETFSEIGDAVAIWEIWNDCELYSNLELTFRIRELRRYINEIHLSYGAWVSLYAVRLSLFSISRAA